MLDSYKAVFFDAGGTLLHPFPSVGEIYQRVAGTHGCKAEAPHIEKLFREAWLRRDGLSHLPTKGTRYLKVPGSLRYLVPFDERAWWRELVHEIFLQVGEFKDFETFFSDLYDQFAQPHCWKLYPGTLEVLAAIRKKKKYLGVISNWDSRLLGLCEGLGMHEYFDFILASAVFGASKPSPKIFQEALRRAGVAPHEAVHIGDSFEDDIKGARGVGMDAILIERHPAHRKLEQVTLIHDLKELIA